MNIQFLNVDLDIKSQQDISMLVNEMGNNITVLYQEKQEDYYFTRLEINKDTTNADLTINYFCDLIENFSEEARKIWNGCCTKMFDIGYESGIKSNSFSSRINLITIERIASIGGSINITIYPISDDRNHSNF